MTAKAFAAQFKKMTDDIRQKRPKCDKSRLLYDNDRPYATNEP